MITILFTDYKTTYITFLWFLFPFLSIFSIMRAHIHIHSIMFLNHILYLMSLSITFLFEKSNTLSKLKHTIHPFEIKGRGSLHTLDVQCVVLFTVLTAPSIIVVFRGSAVPSQPTSMAPHQGQSQPGLIPEP